MEIRKVTRADLKVGMLIPWNVYGNDGRLLARKGYLIASADQIAALVERGQYQGEVDDGADKLPPSALRHLNAARLALQGLLVAIAAAVAPADTRRQLDDVARLIDEAVTLSADVAVACILHNRSASYPVRHSIDTAVVAQLVARALGWAPDAIRSVTLAALTMNVGMLAQHERLHDSRGELSAPDRDYVRSHPEIGVALLRRAGIDDADWLDCVLSHHENIDGSGYPEGRSGDQIPAGARLIALADRYCARVSARQRKPPLPPNVALRELLLQSGQTVDAQQTAVLIRELGIYPVGSCVLLSNGETAIVARKGLSATTPYVDAIIGPRGAPLDVYLHRKTGSMHTIREVLAANPSPVPLRMELIWGHAARL